MTDANDMELVAEFTRRNSEAAFEELVRRHINLVYSVALRYVGQSQDAQDVTHAVFIILAQKAGSLREGTILTGWLYETTRFTCLRFVRTRARRQIHEQEAHLQSTLNEPDTGGVWRQLAPLLEEAMTRLSEKERTLLALRFFENKSAAETAALLGIEEWAARKRVERAVEKLRALFARRGIRISAGVLIAELSAHSIQAAPVALAKTITAVAVVKGATASSSTLTLIKGALKLMAWTKTKIAVVAVVGVLLAAGTVTVAVNKMEQHKTMEPWQVSDIGSDAVAKLAPEVKILPTAFANPGNLAGVAPGVAKFVGIGQPVVNIVWAAYNWPQGRTVFTDSEPTNRYDFVATLDQGCREALQAELKNKLGLMGHHESRDMDVLLLKVRNANAPALRPPIQGGYCYLNRDNNTAEIKWANESISKLVELLESGSKMPIIDQTGLTKRYSVDIKWEEPEGGDPMHSALQKVLLDRLGLELVPSREPVDLLVVEKVK